MKTTTTTTAVVAVLLAFGACQDAPETPETVASPEAATSDADAWSQAYDQFLADFPAARTFIEETAEGTPDVAIASELVRTWAVEHREGWLRPRRRHGRPDSPLVYPGAQAEATVRAMDGIAAYVASVAEGSSPSTKLLDDMWNLGLQWPWDFPELSEPGAVR